MRYLGIDLGTSFIKGGVLNLDDLSISRIQRLPYPDPIPGLHPLFREFDAQKVVATVRELIEAVIADAPDCAGIVMCSQLHNLVFTTGNGKPLSNIISWQDQRALMPHPHPPASYPGGKGTYFDVLNALISPQERRQMGNEPRPGVPLCFLYWLSENNSLPDRPAIVASLPNFVLANLSGTAPTSELTHAMAHGALDMEKLDWHRPVIAKLGLDHMIWPQILPQGEVVCTLKVGGRTLPCYTPVGDYHCAQLGAFLDFDELSVNVSTGSAVTQLNRKMVGGDYQNRPYFDGLYLDTITHIPAGRALNLLVRLLSEMAEVNQVPLTDPWEYILSEADKVSQTDLQMNVAFYASALGDHGEISNIREDNLTTGHLFRAAFQAMAENYYRCALRISPAKAWRRLVFSGGVAQKIELLRRLIIEKFQMDYRLCVSSEDTLLGLLALALAFSGRTPSVQAAMALLRDNYKETGIR